MSARPRESKATIAAQAWQVMAAMAFARFQHGAHLTVLRELGLTPGHLKALGALDPERPTPMNAIADALHCDPSAVTGIVDRLEEAGLAQRRAVASDRRIRAVALTAQGTRVLSRIHEALLAPPDELLALDAASLTTLRDLLRELPQAEGSLPFRTRSAG